MTRRPAHGTGNPLFPFRAADAFHKWYYRDADRTWRGTTWRGVPVHKNPFDLWTYGELIHRIRPKIIIEGGTLEGGSALWFADCCQMIGSGIVLTFDIHEPSALPEHPRLHFYQRDMLDPETLELVRSFIDDRSPVMVILDDDHRQEHVLAELRAYSPLVTPGSYLICEDTNLHNTVWRRHGPGPGEALAQWFEEDDPPFVIDRSCERHGMSFNVRGWLRRKDE